MEEVPVMKRVLVLTALLLSLSCVGVAARAEEGPYAIGWMGWAERIWCNIWGQRAAWCCPSSWAVTPWSAWTGMPFWAQRTSGS